MKENGRGKSSNNEETYAGFCRFPIIALNVGSIAPGEIVMKGFSNANGYVA